MLAGTGRLGGGEAILFVTIQGFDYKQELGPGAEDSRATPPGGMDHGTVMARVHVELVRLGSRISRSRRLGT